MISTKYYLFSFLIFFVACQGKHYNSIGLQQAELKHKKAVKFHQYLKDEVALLVPDIETPAKVMQVSGLSYLNQNVLSNKTNNQIEDFQRMIQKQSIVLDNQKKFLEKYRTKQISIQEQEAQQHKFKKELKNIKQEVQQACSEINILTRSLQQVKKESTVQLANI